MNPNNFPIIPFRLKLIPLMAIALLLIACAAVQWVTFQPGAENEPAPTNTVETQVIITETSPPIVGTPQTAPEIEATIQTDTGGQAATPVEPPATSAATPTPYRLVMPYAAGPESIAGQEWRLVTRVFQMDLEELNFNLYIQAPAIEPETSSAAVTFNREVQALVEKEIDEVKQWLGDTPVEGPGGFEQIHYLVTSAAGWEIGPGSSVYFEESRELSGEQATLNAGREILSVLFEIISYSGGAHPGALHIPLNYDLASRGPLALADLFEEQTDYLGVIHAYSVESLRQRPELVFPEFEQFLSPEAGHYRVWNITPRGILVTFEEYHVAPYASGPQQVLVPYSALEDILDPAGPLGDFAK